MSKSNQLLPKPFLGKLFQDDVKPTITTGYKYTKEEISIHGVENHRAIDFDVVRGTEVLAPCDGWYVATSGEGLLLEEDGKPKKLSVAKARKNNPIYANINPPQKTGTWPIYFGAYTVQGWHGHGRYTQYLHLDSTNKKIPYYKPTIDKESKEIQNSDILRVTVDTYKKSAKAVFLTKGESIGNAGMTGCGWGKPSYDYAKFLPDGRPDFSEVDYPYYTNPHLHFAVFGKRVPRSRNTVKMYDPFGIYGVAGQRYPKLSTDWSKLPNSLWLE